MEQRKQIEQEMPAEEPKEKAAGRSFSLVELEPRVAPSGTPWAGRTAGWGC
jgi:hypothetical protein